MAKTNSKLGRALRKAKSSHRQDKAPLNNHLGQIHDDFEQLLDSYYFLFSAIEVIHVHGSLNDQAVYGLAHIAERLKVQGEIVLGRIREIHRDNPKPNI